MAVQAQYPSNILLLNRNVQEVHDYSLQPQPGGGAGGFLDQSHMFFNNGGSGIINPRKRGREVPATATTVAAAVTTGGGITAPPPPPPQTTATATGTTATATSHPFFSMQPPPPPPTSHPQLIDLSQLHHHHPQPNVVSTGLRLSFGDQQQIQQNHYQQQQQQQQQQPQNFICQSSAFLPLLSEDFATQIKHHRDELDQFLQAQGEQLRRTLAQKRQRHYRALLGAAEESIARRLKEKEAEVEKATRRNADLEARAAQLSVEAQVWQAKARAQEATAASLQAQLQQAIMSAGGSGGPMAQDSRRGEDGPGCAGGVEGQPEDAESAYIDPDRVTAVSGGPSCKACRRRVASVVLLPCRHLCVCTECDQVVLACPLCLQVKNSTVEVYLC